MDTLADTLPYATRPPHGPAAARLVGRLAIALPDSLVTLWRESGRGMVIVDEGEVPRLEPGPFFWRHVQGVTALYLPPDVPQQPLWESTGQWLDHLAGSLGGPQRLSDGHGATPPLIEAAARYASILALGYAAPHFGTDNPARILTLAIAAYHLDHRTLSVADPALTRWLRATLFNEGFWRNISFEGK